MLLGRVDLKGHIHYTVERIEGGFVAGYRQKLVRPLREVVPITCDSMASQCTPMIYEQAMCWPPTSHLAPKDLLP